MMYRITIGGVAICALIAGLAGCQESSRRRPYSPDKSYAQPSRTLRAELVGVVGKEPSSGKFAYGDFGKTRIEGQPIRMPIRPYETIETEGVAKFEINQVIPQDGENKHYFYKALLIGGGGQNGPAVGWIENSAPTFHVSSGWLFVWGRMPLVTTGWVSAGATGSTIAVKIEDEVHRVFYLREPTADDYMWVDCPPGTYDRKIDKPCTYIEVKPSCSIEEYCVKDAPQPLLDELEYIKGIAKAAGWNDGGINCKTRDCK